jgi:meiotically up-regulated gene 157 (Mug157) protein
MMSVELDHIAEMLEKLNIHLNISTISRKYASTIRQAIYDHTITSSGILAYETNGYGGQYIMDDANVPSLVSLPYLGFMDKHDPLYIKTKEAMFSSSNPYYVAGKSFPGIG